MYHGDPKGLGMDSDLFATCFGGEKKKKKEKKERKKEGEERSRSKIKEMCIYEISLCN
jgi:hypothetical protein